jgi:glycosyltransferase involved in cell wall biosynthesis
MMGRPVRVTHVVFDLNGGGMESLVAAMATKWRGTNVSISVITLSGRVGHVGEEVRPLVDEFTVLNPTRMSMLAPTGLASAIRAIKPDVVHLHTGAWLKGVYAARLASVPTIIYTEHGREHDDPLVNRLQDRLAAQWTDHVAAVSPRLSRYMSSAVGVEARRVVTIPNGVDTDVFSPGAASETMRQRLAIPDDAIVIGSVGRLVPVKAYSRLVEAFAEIRSRRPAGSAPLVLVIFGEGGDRATIEATADRLGVRDAVRLPGWTSRPADAYRLLDVFVMTSLSEGMSISLMEAMACGVAPVVTDVGSNAEVVGASLAEHAVHDATGPSLTTRITELIDYPAERAAVGAEARARACSAHSLARTLGEYERLYHREEIT